MVCQSRHGTVVPRIERAGAMTASTARKSLVRAAEDGERRWFFGGGLHLWKATAGDTDGGCLLFADRLGRGKVTPHWSGWGEAGRAAIQVPVAAPLGIWLRTGGPGLTSRGRAGAGWCGGWISRLAGWRLRGPRRRSGPGRFRSAVR